MTAAPSVSAVSRSGDPFMLTLRRPNANGTAARGLRLRSKPAHRSMHSLPLLLGRVLTGVVLALVFTALLAWLQPWVASSWMEQFMWWMQALNIPLRTAPLDTQTSRLWLLPVAAFDLPLRDVHPLAPWVHALAAVALWWLVGWLPDAARPGMFLLRFAVLLHGFAIAYFLIWPASFPHSLFEHTAGGFRQMWVLMLLTPWMHLLIYYLLPFALWSRVALTCSTLIYLFFLTPLLYSAHAALIHHAGLILMPLLELLFGVMVAIIGLVALYGWAMGWPPLPQEDA
jgi:hypothetical protein